MTFFLTCWRHRTSRACGNASLNAFNSPAPPSKWTAATCAGRSKPCVFCRRWMHEWSRAAAASALSSMAKA
eukprot:7115378-Alexandrium_andersonii.AAC.1